VVQSSELRRSEWKTTRLGFSAYAIWGSELSPFALKLRALLEASAIPYAWLPRDGSRLLNYRALWMINRAKRRRTAIRHPQQSDLDEYPLVPFLIEGGRRVYYDSSALARWIDDSHPPEAGPLFPEDPGLSFVAQLIDEAFDEFGLYLVHHKRWVLSAASNDAGARLAREFARVILPGMGATFARRFARRQVRRLPYLFSVAPSGFSIPRLPRDLTPPSRAGFPETHSLLDEAWERHLAGIEAVLESQPFLLGERFTVADAAVYGQLGMNLADPTAAERMRERAPVTHEWLCRIRGGEHKGGAGALELRHALRPLLAIILETFVPLMRQNARAYQEARERGESLFNEPAFDRSRACYDGELLGRPFRSVVKTFQVRVWRELCDAWDALPEDARVRVSRLLPDGVALGEEL
jgi:glutathione S-transferase